MLLVILIIGLRKDKTFDMYLMEKKDRSRLTTFELENILNDANIPGLVAIVVNRTDILYEQAVGYHFPGISKERQPMDSSKSIFVLASISKTFIVIAVMQLVEQNLLDLDQDINKYLSTVMKVQIGRAHV